VGSQRYVLTSGSKTADPARVLGGSAMRSLVDSATELGYSYVLLDAPPMGATVT
jgi:Mrp family chromosome partitioning ATPase